MGKPPAIAAQSTTGPVAKCPCPWCNKPNNFTESDHLLSESDNAQGDDDPGGGAMFFCDHCKQKMRVVGVRMIKVITLRQAK